MMEEAYSMVLHCSIVEGEGRGKGDNNCRAPELPEMEWAAEEDAFMRKSESPKTAHFYY